MKTRRSRLLSASAALVLSAGFLTGCGQSDDAGDGKDENPGQVEQTEAAETEAAETEGAKSGLDTEGLQVGDPVDKQELSDALVASMEANPKYKVKGVMEVVQGENTQNNQFDLMADTSESSNLKYEGTVGTDGENVGWKLIGSQQWLRADENGEWEPFDIGQPLLPPSGLGYGMNFGNADQVTYQGREEMNGVECDSFLIMVGENQFDLWLDDQSRVVRMEMRAETNGMQVYSELNNSDYGADFEITAP